MNILDHQGTPSSAARTELPSTSTGITSCLFALPNTFLYPKNRHQRQQLQLPPKLNIIIDIRRDMFLKHGIIIPENNQHGPITRVHEFKILRSHPAGTEFLIVRARPREGLPFMVEAVLAAFPVITV